MATCTAGHSLQRLATSSHPFCSTFPLDLHHTLISPLQVVSAYILGTITSLVIGADERMKEYRQAMGELENYGRTHNIPEVRQSS
jgi:hypothetical protein